MKYFKLFRVILFFGSTTLLSIIFLMQEDGYLLKSFLKAFVIAIIIVYVLPTLFNYIEE